jgi:hypothetical protein
LKVRALHGLMLTLLSVIWSLGVGFSGSGSVTPPAY